jgi:hypothetical protein
MTRTEQSPLPLLPMPIVVQPDLQGVHWWLPMTLL